MVTIMDVSYAMQMDARDRMIVPSTDTRQDTYTSNA
jgi:hypothetical protein